MNYTIAPSWQYVNHHGWGLGSTVRLIKARDRSTLMYPYLDNDESTVLRWSVQGRVPLGAFALNLPPAYCPCHSLRNCPSHSACVTVPPWE